MQRRLAIISLIVMSSLLIIQCVSIVNTNIDGNFIVNTSYLFFLLLMFKKGLETRAFKDIFNIKKEKILLTRENALIEIIICIEFVIINDIPNISLVEYEQSGSAIINSIISVGFTIIFFIALYRFFFLNMFNQEIISYEWMNKITKSSKTDSIVKCKDNRKQ